MLYTLLYIKEIINKDPLCGTGKSTQNSVIVYMGKESKKRIDTCIYITDSLYCMSEINTMLQINYTPIKLKMKSILLLINVI